MIVCYDEQEMHTAIKNELGMHFPVLSPGHIDGLADDTIMRLRRDCTDQHCVEFSPKILPE